MFRWPSRKPHIEEVDMALRRATLALLMVLAVGAGTALAQDASPSPGTGTETGAASPEPMASPATTTTQSPAPGAVEGEIEVSAVEYAFVGVPETVPAGTTFRLRNDGQEVHEFALVRRNEGTEQSVEELLAMGDEGFAL